jgi:hypothetical protein
VQRVAKLITLSEDARSARDVEYPLSAVMDEAERVGTGSLDACRMVFAIGMAHRDMHLSLMKAHLDGVRSIGEPRFNEDVRTVLLVAWMDVCAVDDPFSERTALMNAQLLASALADACSVAPTLAQPMSRVAVELARSIAAGDVEAGKLLLACVPSPIGAWTARTHGRQSACAWGACVTPARARPVHVCMHMSGTCTRAGMRAHLAHTMILAAVHGTNASTSRLARTFAHHVKRTHTHARPPALSAFTMHSVADRCEQV